MISFAGANIVRDDGGGGFWGGISNAKEVEGKGKATEEVGGTMGVSSEGEVPAETKAGAVAQTRSL